MNRNAICIALAGLLAPAGVISAATVPYQSDLGDSYNICADWTQQKTSEKYWSYDRESDYSTPGTSGGVVHNWETGKPNAMLISPAITLTGGTQYTVSLWVKTSGTSGDREAFKVFMGPEATLAALSATDPIIAEQDYANRDDFEQKSYTFTPADSGDVYFGILACSESYQGNLHCTGFAIVEGDHPIIDVKPEVVKDIPYQTNFETKGEFNEWSSLAGPDAGVSNPWSYNSYSKRAEFDYSEGEMEDNYFISPGLNITQPGEYLVTMGYTAYGTLEVLVGTDNKDLSTFSRKVFSLDDVTHVAEVAEFPITFTEAGKYYIALRAHATSGSYMGYNITDFKIKDNAAVPALVSDLKAVSDPTDALKVSLSWTYPSKNHLGGDLDAIDHAEIYRNGELLVSLTEGITPGMKGSYNDEPATAGLYSYTIKVFGTNGAFDAEPMVASAGYVGRPVAEFPFSLRTSYADDEELQKYTIEDANNDGLTWGIEEEWYQKYFTCVAGNSDGSVFADDYLATPYLHLTPGYYRFTSEVQAHENSFEVGYCTDRHDIAGTFHKLGGVVHQQEYGFNTCEVVVPIDVEGDYCLVWRHYGLPGNYVYNTISLSEASLTAHMLLPETASEVTVRPVDRELKAAIEWTNPSIDNAGRDLTSLSKVEIYRNGEVIAEINSDVVPGNKMSHIDNVPAEGEYTYSVKVYNSNGASETEAEKYSVFVGKANDVPYEAGFKDWSIDDTYYKWAVSPLGDAYFARGTYDDANYAAGIYSPYLYLENNARYIVTIDTYGADALESCDFSLRCGYAPATATEFDRVVRSGDGKKSHTYKVHAFVPGQEEDVPAGVSVVPAGNVVFGMFVDRNTTANVSGFKIEKDPEFGSGVNAVAAIKSSITVKGNKAYFNEGMKNVTVADMTGRVLFTASEAPATLSLESYNGLIIITATTPEGTKETAKAIR